MKQVFPEVRLAELWAKAYPSIGPEVREPERSRCVVATQD
jgi:hypothetical protein